MSTPKAPSRNRDRNGKSSNRPGGAGAGETTPSTPAGPAATATGGGDTLLAYHPVESLQSLQELLRPSAASRIAAVARAFHMSDDHSAASSAVVGEQESRTSAHGLSDFTSPSSVPGAGPSTFARPPPSYASTAPPKERVGKSPPPSPFVEATIAPPPSIHNLTPKDLDVRAVASGTLPVPPLSLVLECATQLNDMWAQWRTSNESERCCSSPQPRAPLPPRHYSSPAGQTSQYDSMPPTSPVRGSVAAGNPPRSMPQPIVDRSTTAPPPGRPSAQRVLQMMDLVLWYCLSTTEDARLATGSRSRGTSGLATPSGGGLVHTLVGGGGSTPFGFRGVRAGRPGSASVAGGRQGCAARSGSGSADPMSAHDWLGSRMSSASSTAGAPSIISDEQLAERLFRLAVDAVVFMQGSHRQSPVSSSPPLSPSSHAHSTDKGSRLSHNIALVAARGPKGGPAQPPTEDVTDEADATTVELQTRALWTLAAVLARFAGVTFNATVFLPVLFPQVDVCGPAAAAARHPLLQPLLRGDPRCISLRCGAAAALTALLHRLRPTLQYAEEPQQGRQTAFLSLAAQCGTMLASLHEGLCWGLIQEHEQAQGAASDTVALTPLWATALPILNAYATVVTVTPYHRCPRSHAIVLQTLQLPVMHFLLAHDEVCAFVPATVLVSSILRNDSVRGAEPKPLGAAGTKAGEPSHSKDSRVEVTGGDCAAAAAAASSLLSALLSHADTRVEVWHCMVPLSRLYPRLVQSEFDALMIPSVRVVSMLTEWEAAENAAVTAAIAGASPAVSPEGDATSHQQRPSGTPLLSTKFAAGAEGNTAEEPGLLPFMYGEMRNTGPGAGTVPPLPQRSDLPAALLDAFAECLRTWLHYMGYVWRAFDDNASDPAQRSGDLSGRATLEHKRRIHEELLRPTMRLRRCGDDVRTVTLRCIAQIGNDYVSTVTDRSLCEEFVAYVRSSVANPQPRVRGEALTTLGVWLWQYTALDDFACVTIDSAVHSLTMDPNPVVRTKAAFALSNVTARLPEGSCTVVRDSPGYIATLCATAMHAAVTDTESGVQGHGIRMMNHLLQVLTLDELISEVEGFEEGVAEGFLRVLLECLRADTRGSPSTCEENSTSAAAVRYAAPREAKHRWNAACALGMGLARQEVFEAEPKYAVEAVEALCTAVVRDHIFKVRTQAAGALGRIPGHCLSGTYSVTDLTPIVVGSLCKALETATSTENFRQYKEQGTLHDALRSALAVMITSAAPSNDLEKVFTSYMKLLQKEALL
ncbi:hypothetical protein JKF63_05072 [Porcisia hertigi]|uniref:DUF4042 domain-containing protein n=1 Tax=Porcisia hertigi TaxID=2761500 RepID=A0A836IT97_9TRYP|nr:hypothetical protein JKF63_05072 [Porcisia hertigi]